MTNSQSHLPDDRLTELHALTAAALAGNPTEDQVARLDQMVCEDSEFRRLYVRYMFTSLNLRTWAQYPLSDAVEAQLGSPPPDADMALLQHLTSAGQNPPDASCADVPSLPPSSFDIRHSSFAIQSSRSPLPPVIIQAFPSPLSPLPSFFGGMLFSYLMAALIIGLGLVIGAVVHVSGPTNMVRQSAPRKDSNPLSPIPNPSSVVARITGAVDCQWEETRSAENHQSSIPNPKSVVYLGDRIALRSGLLEITYDTGARVILQGPVTYEIESPAGGFLAIGKLTAKLEKTSVVRGQRSASANQKSEIRDHTFAVRTPTATVTDLGTEFGVEVSKEGNTTSHVFRGAVEVRPTGDGRNPAGQAIRLTANESVKVGRSPHATEIRADRAAIDPAVFVRPDQLPKLAEEEQQRKLSRWRTYSRQLQSDPALLAYYTFDPAALDKTILPNLSRAGNALDGRIEGATWADGRLPGKRSLYFHGTSSLDKVVLPEQQRFKFEGPFSLAVWFKVKRFSAMTHTLMAKGVTSWQLQQDKRTRQISFDTVRKPNSSEPWDVTRSSKRVDDSQWHLVVSVFEPKGNVAHRSVYIDGRLEAEADSPATYRQNDEPVWIGADSELSWDEFSGWIDEVAIFTRALSYQQVVAMFEAGAPSGAVAANPESAKALHAEGGLSQ